MLIIVKIKNRCKQKSQKNLLGSLSKSSKGSHSNKSAEIQKNTLNRNKKTKLESNDSEKDIKIIAICWEYLLQCWWKRILKHIKRRIIREKGMIVSLLSSVRPIYKVSIHIFKRWKIVQGTEKRHFQML